MPPADKSTLRAQLRQARRDLGVELRDQLATQAAGLLQQLPGWQQARKVAVYMAADGELDPAAIAGRGRSEGKQLYLPVIQPDSSLLFAPWHTGAQLLPNRYGIPEPQTAAEPAASLDILFMPLVGWDPSGTRLGMGGGYYDRSLQHAGAVLKVGLGFDVQRADALPRDGWDIALDYIVTGESLIRAGGEA